jgi:FixJ family two-component response regulator
MTGLELQKKLVEAGYAIPTILVTAYPDDLGRARALNNGAVCYLSKPVDDEHLERCLRTALESGNP